MSREKLDSASKKMLNIAKTCGICTVWDRFDAQQPSCGFGNLGLCCTNCNLGPCRVDPFGEGAQVGVCGADADIISSRNLARNAAGGASCHSDHGRELAHILMQTGMGLTKGYRIKDEEKLFRIAEEFKVATAGKTKKKVAEELGR